MSVPVRSTTGTIESSTDVTFNVAGDAQNITFDAGTDADRFLWVTISWDGAGAHTIGDSAVTYNGVAMTALGATLSGTNHRVRSYGLIAPATGSNTLSVDPSGGADIRNAVVSAHCLSNVDQTTAYENYNSALGTDASNPYTSAVTITSSATDRLVAVAHSVRATSVTGGTATGFTERTDNVNGVMGLVTGEQAGDTSVATSVSWAGVFSIDYIAIGISVIGIAAGPTIDTQPTAQTARLHGDPTTAATFTVAATTSGGALFYDWELETSVGGGVYANLSDGSGATWTGQASASAVGTFTATTLTGRRVRCNVTDSNGTVTTNAVTLTVLNGPVLSASSGTTNGSGVSTLTITSDDPLTTNGEVYRVTIVAGSVTKRTYLRAT